MRRAAATAILIVVLGGCSGGSSPDPAAPVPADEPSGLPTRVVGDARDVADQLEQRYAELESMVP